MYKKTYAAFALAALLMGPMAALAESGGPTVALTSGAAYRPETPTNVTWQDPIPFSVTLSSSTSAFDASDITVVGALGVQNFAGSGTSYTFEVDPGDDDPLHASEPRYVRVEVRADAFDGNQASNVIEFWFDPGAAPVDTEAPTITFDAASPAEGSTIYTASASATTTGFAFGWSVNDASSTVMCSIVGSGEADTFYSCGSPQTFSAFPAGSYRFTLKATDTSSNTATSSRTFTIAMGTTTPTSATTTASTTPVETPAPSSGGGGGGSNGQVVGSGPSAPSAPGGLQDGYFNPNAIIPTVPTGPAVVVVPAEPEVAGVQTEASRQERPVVTRPGSASSAAARVTSAPRAEEVAATIAPAADTTPRSPAEESPLAGDTLGAAAATTPDIPTGVVVWSLIGILLIAGLGYLFYRPA